MRHVRAQLMGPSGDRLNDTQASFCADVSTTA